MNDKAFAQEYAKELAAEVPSTTKCLERIPLEKFDWKPHERSMQLGYLALLTGEIPRWITHIILQPEIDLATFAHDQQKTGQELAGLFNKNVNDAVATLNNVADGDLEAKFELKTNGQVVLSSTKREQVAQCINHMVHHRGQLTVYMRLLNIAVPSIYGPSADDKNFSSK
ncbi:DinB family protein [Mucilaginibacter calamicampi]|uniref:DinB family protein n=1 Tax=Mucilaginibacter calamicampi TaxID=1302352 RepID=A0ABW2YXV4_9SPHI